MNNLTIEQAGEYVKTLLTEQQARIQALQSAQDWVDYTSKETLRIGICWGDGIGEHISKQAQRVLEHCLKDAIASGNIVLVPITGLTIENRAAKNAAIPEDILAELKACDVILKGPTTTPQKGDSWPNIESANVAMRRELDLFACVRPIVIPEKNIDWTFFRENTEGAYMLGSKGIHINNDMSLDFKVISNVGAERIIRLAFEYAKQNGKKRVTVVTKSNVVKATDGRFSEVAATIAKEYEADGIVCDEWYIDIMTAKLIDPSRQASFQVFVLPNLYGDILTDEASQIQGGVGTAGSANIGKQYAMFEAVHGSAPRMVSEGRAAYADPSSMIKAAAMLMRHIGYTEPADRVEHALQVLPSKHPDTVITGHDDGATGEALTSRLLALI
jgi:isocitrate dehydrogenase (NAD+)